MYWGQSSIVPPHPHGRYVAGQGSHGATSIPHVLHWTHQKVPSLWFSLHCELEARSKLNRKSPVKHEITQAFVFFFRAVSSFVYPFGQWTAVVWCLVFNDCIVRLSHRGESRLEESMVIHWTEEGVKMENQNASLVIRPSRTPKTNPKNYFCSKSLSTMGAKLVVFQPFTV